MWRTNFAESDSRWQKMKKNKIKWKSSYNVFHLSLDLLSFYWLQLCNTVNYIFEKCSVSSTNSNDRKCNSKQIDCSDNYCKSWAIKITTIAISFSKRISEIAILIRKKPSNKIRNIIRRQNNNFYNGDTTLEKRLHKHGPWRIQTTVNRLICIESKWSHVRRANLFWRLLSQFYFSKQL